MILHLSRSGDNLPSLEAGEDSAEGRKAWCAGRGLEEDWMNGCYYRKLLKVLQGKAADQVISLVEADRMKSEEGAGVVDGCNGRLEV